MGSCFDCCNTNEKEPNDLFARYEERGITDLIFFVIFLGFWVAMFIVFARAGKDGANINRVLKGVDLDGHICGKDDPVKNLPVAIWPSPFRSLDIKFCAADCNETVANTLNHMEYQYYSKNLFNYCVPWVNLNGTFDIRLSGDFDSTSQESSRAMSDLYLVWPVILASAFVALIFSFVYLFLCRYLAGYLVWFFFLCLIFGGFLTGYALLKKAQEADDSLLKRRAQAMKGLGWGAVAGTVVFLCIVFFFRDRIVIAIEIVKEAAEAFNDMPNVVWFPFYPFIFGLLYFFYWIVMTIYLFSVATPVLTPLPDPYFMTLFPERGSNPNYTNYEWNDEYKRAFAAHFMHLLWNVQFVVYLVYFILAGAIANWYFTPRGNDQKKIRGDGPKQLPNSPILASCIRSIRFHLGTVALASLIIATVTFIRACIRYLESQLKAITGDPGRIQKIFFCLVQCCLCCVECCLDKISKSALVWCAIWGSSFVPSCCSSFRFIWDNLARVAALHLVTGYLVLLGKVIVALATAGACGVALERVYGEDLHSTAMPMAVMFILAYLVSTIFMVAFECTIDTIFLCFLVDEKINSGTNNMYAHQSLIDVVNKYKPQSEILAQRMKTKLGDKPQNLQQSPQQMNTLPPQQMNYSIQQPVQQQQPMMMQQQPMMMQQQPMMQQQQQYSGNPYPY